MTKKIDGFHLKVIAIVGMLINHAGQLFEWGHNPQLIPLFAFSEFVGRFTFPIMAYLLVEGYHYTRNVKKYAMRLALFWVLSIYPFYLLHNPNYAFSITDIPNNIFFTLLMGLVMITCYSKTNSRIGHFLIVVLFMSLTFLSDWNLIGIVMIWAFYKYHNDKGIKIISVSYFLLFIIISIIGFFTATNSIEYVAEGVSAFGFLGVGFLLLNYNGSRGYSPTWVKWGFYIFYPLHLMFLEYIRYIVL
ncbi:TraX family protein [Enterococcus gilvus]|uniref:TraX family protein n=1 Tax=Enterococcus gilvus TaxID=160453 RepID=UPI0029115EC9|nr:TraX family protein [Enterococcus gilvus]MDU5511940.1 TraX family protein [Enterococcus gilvus]